MSDNITNKWFNRLKKEGENTQLSNNHISRFEDRLNASKPKKKRITLALVYKIAAVFILGIALIPMLNNTDEKTHPEYQKYQETKSYFTAYVEYEIGRHKEDVILSALHEVVKLQHDYAQLEKEFIEQNYDKRILKRMIENFRQQLDILENIDRLLELNQQTKNTDENII